jgi:ketosteroid isomerase-like protein
MAQLEPTWSQPDDLGGIKAANAAYHSALSAQDVSAMEKVWARDEQVSNIFSAAKSPSFGPSAIKADYEDLFKRLGSVSVAMADPSVRQQGELALVIGVETAQGKLPNGESIRFSPVATNVFLRRDGQWLMIHHHTSRPPQ